MLHYYETYEYTHTDEPPTDDGIDLKGSCTATAHDTIDDAIEYADAHGLTLIAEIGGSWDEYKKCWWCGEWCCDVNSKSGLCDHCENYLISRGEI